MSVVPHAGNRTEEADGLDPCTDAEAPSPVPRPEPHWEGTLNRVPAPKRRAGPQEAEPPDPMDAGQEGASASADVVDSVSVQVAVGQGPALLQNPSGLKHEQSDDDEDVVMISSIPSPQTKALTGGQQFINLVD